jgi:hypothetical protein
MQPMRLGRHLINQTQMDDNAEPASPETKPESLMTLPHEVSSKRRRANASNRVFRDAFRSSRPDAISFRLSAATRYLFTSPAKNTAEAPRCVTGAMFRGREPCFLSDLEARRERPEFLAA